MLLSDFLLNGGQGSFDSQSQEYNITADITIDTDSAYNCHILLPDADGYTATLSAPTTVEAENQIIINTTAYSITISADEDYVLPTNKVFFYTWNGTTWLKYQADLIASTPVTPPGPVIPPLGQTEFAIVTSDDPDDDNDDYFGNAVVIDDTGVIAFIGAERKNKVGTTNIDDGAVYVFRWDGATWVEGERINPINPPTGSYNFGHNMAINSDGTKLVVSAYRDRDVGANGGAVYTFEWNGSGWDNQKLTASDVAAGDWFGHDVAMSSDGSVLLVGTTGADDSGSGSGLVYAYTWNGTTWTNEQKLEADDAVGGLQFGFSVDMSSDGTKCVISAYGFSSYRGAAYVFKNTGGVWSQEQKLTGDGNIQWFGKDVEMSNDGTRCIISAESDTFSSGAAYVFFFNGSAWVEEQKLVADVRENSSRFGQQVSMNGDGSICAIGHPYYEVTGTQDGAVHIFTRTGTTWTRTDTFTAGDGVGELGRSVDINYNGTKVVCGDYMLNYGVAGVICGGVYIY